MEPAVELPGWLKLLISLGGGAFAWGLVVVLSKSWVESNVIKPIEELKKQMTDTQQNFVQFTERINSLVMDLVKNSKDGSTHHSKIIKEMSDEIRQALHVSGAAIERVQAAEETTEKLFKITKLVHKKNEYLESEIKQLTKDLIFIKTRKEE